MQETRFQDITIKRNGVHTLIVQARRLLWYRTRESRVHELYTVYLFCRRFICSAIPKTCLTIPSRWKMHNDFDLELDAK
jgi:hypothetical protein